MLLSSLTAADKVTTWPFLNVTFDNIANPQLIPSRAFNTLDFNAVVSDSHASFGGNTDYSVPQDGVYEITLKMRLKDNIGAGISYAIGVNTSNIDAPFVSWYTTTAADNSSNARQGANYLRKSYFAKGSVLRAFMYWDSSTTAVVNSLDLAIERVR